MNDEHNHAACFSAFSLYTNHRTGNRPYAREIEFISFDTKKFVSKSYWEIPKGKVWNALVQEKSSVRAPNMTHQITLKR